MLKKFCSQQDIQSIADLLLLSHGLWGSVVFGRFSWVPFTSCSALQRASLSLQHVEAQQKQLKIDNYKSSGDSGAPSVLVNIRKWCDLHTQLQHPSLWISPALVLSSRFMHLTAHELSLVPLVWEATSKPSKTHWVQSGSSNFGGSMYIPTAQVCSCWPQLISWTPHEKSSTWWGSHDLQV